MSYLILFLLLAALGIGALWFHQKRQRASIDSVDGFRASLERLSGHSVAVPETDENGESTRVVMSSRRLEPLDPERREAARRRLQARRAPGTSH